MAELDQRDHIIRRQKEEISALYEQLHNMQKHECAGTLTTITFSNRKLVLCRLCAIELIEECKHLEYTINRIDRKG